MFTLFKSVLESLALQVSLDGCLLLWHLHASQSAEEEMTIVLVSGKELLII